MLDAIDRIDAKIPQDYKGNERVVAISYAYNHPINQGKYLEMMKDKGKFSAMLKSKSEKHVWIRGVRYGGLKKRRQDEYLLFNQ